MKEKYEKPVMIGFKGSRAEGGTNPGSCIDGPYPYKACSDGSGIVPGNMYCTAGFNAEVTPSCKVGGSAAASCTIGGMTQWCDTGTSRN